MNKARDGNRSEAREGGTWPTQSNMLHNYKERLRESLTEEPVGVDIRSGGGEAAEVAWLVEVRQPLRRVRLLAQEVAQHRGLFERWGRSKQAVQRPQLVYITRKRLRRLN